MHPQVGWVSSIKSIIHLWCHSKIICSYLVRGIPHLGFVYIRCFLILYHGISPSKHQLGEFVLLFSKHLKTILSKSKSHRISPFIGIVGCGYSAKSNHSIGFYEVERPFLIIFMMTLSINRTTLPTQMESWTKRNFRFRRKKDIEMLPFRGRCHVYSYTRLETQNF